MAKLLERSWKQLVSLAPKFTFAHKTNVKYTTGKTSYEIVSVSKQQFLLTLKIRLYRNEHELCFSDFCMDLPSHSHSEKNLKNQLLDKLLQPQDSHALLERKRDLKRNYSAIFERSLEHTARSQASGNRFKLAQHFDIGQTFFTRVFVKIFPGAKKFNNDDLAHLQLPNVLRAQLTRYKMTMMLWLQKL